MSLTDESGMKYGNPKLILILSGKRKSGKDFVADILLERFGSENCIIIRLSAPLKERYAIEHKLDYQKLLDASEYKEKYRLEMIKWSEKIRSHDYTYFCRYAIQQPGTENKKIWIISDARRKTDIKFFLENFPHSIKTIRISASLETRKQRGWKFMKGVDDRESECGLDDYENWDYQLSNNNTDEVMKGIDNIAVLNII